MALIEVKDITKTYKTESVAVEALRGIDLTVQRGEFSAIMGSSGSGKSTLMNIIGCLDQATGGQYLLNGQDVAQMHRNQLSEIRNKMLGFVFQSFHLLPRTTALENVELPLIYSREELSWKEIRRRAREAIERVGLQDRMKHTPNELSGGQKQRVAVARALVTEPEILLADEPTGNLDSRTGLELIDLIQNLNSQGLTTLMVTHEAEIARFARRVIRLHDGRIISDEHHESMSASEALEDVDEDHHHSEDKVTS
ncbi:ABC transporter ATP-binding protein [Natronogracilivirga saccharolytica]|uniref:ABC transporter ATP-binding protein n=1 Tax=Natronogracilivirga saccharolytica TaxID=2812953 RepID=UPI001FE9D965|nr:ABC transporter ATP-binding protein [Natronogracilivirga saccharolytica]